MVYFALNIFLSAFLLFQVQPLTGKLLLPWFGGSPAVWSAAVLFFQVVLLLGYGYAYLLARIPREKHQGLLHGAFLALSSALLCAGWANWSSPIAPGADWRPGPEGPPVLHIFKILGAAVGIPFFLLSSNSTLMQSWFHRARPGLSPYPLYTVSNAGSLAALLSYPFIIEPSLSLSAQGRLWVLAYGVYAVLTGYGAFTLIRRNSPPSPPEFRNEAEGHTGGGRKSEIFLWWLPAACASTMLLATTNQICQNVAVVPFLWVLPLTLYLLTFILAFSGERYYSRKTCLPMLAVATVLFSYVHIQGIDADLLLQITTYSIALFFTSMVCHGEMVRLKPPPRRLPLFYLTLAGGGACGGLAVTFVAPILFHRYWELEIGMVGTWAFLLLLFVADGARKPLRRSGLIPVAGLTVAVSFLALLFFVWADLENSGVIHSSRNFYGILRVREVNPGIPGWHTYSLEHGSITHGHQYRDPGKKRTPTTYYTKDSGVGIAAVHHPLRPSSLRVGVVGLGVGTLAAYGEEGDILRFYEINPEIIKLAKGDGSFFTFLSDSPATIEIVHGDARMSMERELREGRNGYFDLLVIDAFSGDAVPLHLLTSEAFDAYLGHLRKEGILAFHVSNRYLELAPVVRRLAGDRGMPTVTMKNEGSDDGFASTWVLATKNREFQDLLMFPPAEGARDRGAEAAPLWTDDYSNLLQVLTPPWRD